MSWLQKLLPPRIKSTPGVRKQAVPEGLWVKCVACEAVLYRTDLEKNLGVCPKCSHHGRVAARERLDQLLDAEGRFEIGAEVLPIDSLKFKDSRKYPDRLAAALEETGETVRVLLRVLELEAVDRHHLRADLEPALGIEQLVDALARRHPRVVRALRADVEVLLEVGPVEHGLARGALDPQPLGHRRPLGARRALDARRKQFLQPAHPFPPNPGCC